MCFLVLVCSVIDCRSQHNSTSRPVMILCDSQLLQLSCSAGHPPSQRLANHQPLQQQQSCCPAGRSSPSVQLGWRSQAAGGESFQDSPKWNSAGPAVTHPSWPRWSRQASASVLDTIRSQSKTSHSVTELCHGTSHPAEAQQLLLHCEWRSGHDTWN